MKKIYESPVTKVLNVELNQMIAASTQEVKVGGSYNGGAIDTRGGNAMWDSAEVY